MGFEKPHVSLAAETLFHLGPLSVTNSMLTMWLVMLGLVFFFILATRRMELMPRGVQNFAEFVIEALANLVEGTAGRRVGRQIFPLIATLFLFILTANYAGLLPGVGTIGFQEAGSSAPGAYAGPIVQVASVAGQGAASGAVAVEAAKPCFLNVQLFCSPKVPLFRAPNADLNMTVAMAILAIFVVQYSGVAAHGVAHFKEFLNPIHAVGEFSRIISLSARLFGNIFGGEVLLVVIIALTAPFLGLFGLIPAIFYGLELFFGFVQALLFSLLTLIYIVVAVAGHGDHEQDEHTEHGAAGAVEHASAELAA